MSKLKSSEIFAVLVDIAILVVGFHRTVSELLVKVGNIGI